MWHNTPVQLFLERYLLPACAAATVTLLLVNPMKFDWTQRVTLGLSILFFAWFTAHTVSRNGRQPGNDGAEIAAAQRRPPPSTPETGPAGDSARRVVPEAAASAPKAAVPAPEPSGTAPAASPIPAARPAPSSEPRTPKKESASLYINQARSLYAQERFADALAKCDKALRLEPSNREALELRRLIKSYKDTINQ